MLQISKLEDLKLTENQYDVRVALSNAQDSEYYQSKFGVQRESGLFAYHFGTSTYTDAESFIGKSTAASFRGLERKGYIKIVDSYWRGMLVVSMVRFETEEEAAVAPALMKRPGIDHDPVKPWNWATMAGRPDPVEILSYPDPDGTIMVRTTVGDPTTLVEVPVKDIAAFSPDRHEQSYDETEEPEGRYS